MDISDKNFRPCPCGYQICQFCYNNIRQNPELNGRCPGCRRLYDDESVEYKTLTIEEYKMQQVRKEKREREKKQKEKEKKELEIASKKHLAGLRVVQKNLVYVTGLNPPCPADDLHSVLRSDKYFGQYGKILKIVVNRKAPAGPGPHAPGALNQSIVVYVTFARKEDALRCINELDGLLCDGRVLRAAHGTTKYCLSYLRGHPCPNPNCMFLHEPGEEADSYTRKDLLTQQGIKMGMSGLQHGSGINLHHHFGEDEPVSEDERGLSANATPATAPVVPVAAAASNPTPVINHVGPVLPATAHWAKATAESANASPSVAGQASLANAAAFPTLGEIFKDQKTHKKETKKGRRSNKDGVLLPDDVDIDDNSVLLIADSTAARLAALASSQRELQVYFDDLAAPESVLPLFHFDDRIASSSPTLDDEKLLATVVIERFLLRPMKKYDLAYLNHPVSQQQQFLQQQAQLQQQQQQAQAQAHALQAQTPVIAQRLQLLNLNQPQDSIPQQQMLLMQLQQQNGKPPQGVPVQLPGGHLNGLRLSERNTSATPPPPGLFGKSQDAAVPSSSSQLLTQLMSGKK